MTKKYIVNSYEYGVWYSQECKDLASAYFLADITTKLGFPARILVVTLPKNPYEG